MLTSVPGGESVSIASAVYSPDGKKIAYLQCDGDCGDPGLHVNDSGLARGAIGAFADSQGPYPLLSFAARFLTVDVLF